VEGRPPGDQEPGQPGMRGDVPRDGDRREGQAAGKQNTSGRREVTPGPREWPDPGATISPAPSSQRAYRTAATRAAVTGLPATLCAQRQTRMCWPVGTASVRGASRRLGGGMVGLPKVTVGWSRCLSMPRALWPSGSQIVPDLARALYGTSGALQGDIMLGCEFYTHATTTREGSCCRHTETERKTV